MFSTTKGQITQGVRNRETTHRNTGHRRGPRVCRKRNQSCAGPGLGTGLGRTTAIKAEPTANQRLFGDFAPKFVDLTDNVLFADVWERPCLSKHDRSLVTVAALIAMNRPDQLRFHLARARENGVTQEELVEAITHLAFYAGWPSATAQ